MNTCIRNLMLAVSLLTGIGPLTGAEDKPAPEPQRKPMRVLTPPTREGRLLARPPERRENVEMETVAFLGVETSPVSITTSVQLGLQRGTGLVVHHIVPKSAVDGVLKEHDILLQLDDQILIETRQLSVLIRNKKEGDEVTLTYLRSGQKSTAKVKLGKTDVPKMADVFETMAPGGRFEFAMPPRAENERAEVDRVLGMIARGRPGDPVRVQINREGGPGFRAMSMHTENSNLTYSDDDGSMELTMKDGTKTLVAKGPGGEVLFSGPATTPDERKAMPDAVRARLEKLEGMHNITFRTDGDFRGAESKTLRPRGIAFPPQERAALPPARTFF